MNIIPSENHGWNESMDQTISGLPVYIIIRNADEFIDLHTPVLSVKLTPVGDERNYDDFVFVTIEDNPKDLSGKISPDIFVKVLEFIKLNQFLLEVYWTDYLKIMPINELVEVV